VCTTSQHGYSTAAPSVRCSRGERPCGGSGLGRRVLVRHLWRCLSLSPSLPPSLPPSSGGPRPRGDPARRRPTMRTTTSLPSGARCPLTEARPRAGVLRTAPCRAGRAWGTRRATRRGRRAAAPGSSGWTSAQTRVLARLEMSTRGTTVRKGGGVDATRRARGRERAAGGEHPQVKAQGTPSPVAAEAACPSTLATATVSRGWLSDRVSCALAMNAARRSRSAPARWAAARTGPVELPGCSRSSTFHWGRFAAPVRPATVPPDAQNPAAVRGGLVRPR
jgi:hypothetical protein